MKTNSVDRSMVPWAILWTVVVITFYSWVPTAPYLLG